MLTGDQQLDLTTDFTNARRVYTPNGGRMASQLKLNGTQLPRCDSAWQTTTATVFTNDEATTTDRRVDLYYSVTSVRRDEKLNQEIIAIEATSLPACCFRSMPD